MPRRDTEAKPTARTPKSKPSWTDVKTKLAGLDRLALTSLIQNLYAASKDNRVFLHARFGLGDDVLAPYKETIERWLWTDILRNQNYSVAKAKQVISGYRKAVGAPEGLAELMVFFCETAAGFCSDIGMDDESYFDALVRMFEQAVKAVAPLPAGDRDAMKKRLDRVRIIGSNFGYGVDSDLNFLFTQLTGE
jgi:hypothetical protein